MIFVVLTLWISFRIACTQTAVYLSSTQTEDWRFTTQERMKPGREGSDNWGRHRAPKWKWRLNESQHTEQWNQSYLPVWFSELIVKLMLPLNKILKESFLGKLTNPWQNIEQVRTLGVCPIQQLHHHQITWALFVHQTFSVNIMDSQRSPASGCESLT